MNDDEMHKAAELSFGRFADKPTPELLDLLCDGDAVTRHAATTALQKRGEREAFERGVELTRDERVFVRENAAFLLGQLGYSDGYPFRDESAPILEDLLNRDPSADVRASAVAALGHLGAKPALDSLARAADDADPAIRANVAFALCGIETPGVGPLIGKLRNDRDAEVTDWAELAMEMLFGKEFEQETVETLCEMLADAEFDIVARKAAAEILAGRDEMVAWERACAFRNSEVATLRLNAPMLARWLGRGKEAPPRAEVIGMLVGMLRNDPESRVRDQTAAVLAEFEGAEVLDSLVAAARDPAWQVRHSVAFALSRHGPPEADAPLEELCSDPDERVARYARERFDWMNGIFRSSEDN